MRHLKMLFKYKKVLQVMVYRSIFPITRIYMGSYASKDLYNQTIKGNKAGEANLNL